MNRGKFKYAYSFDAPGVLLVVEIRSMQVYFKSINCPSYAATIPIGESRIFVQWLRNAIIYDIQLGQVVETLPQPPRSLYNVLISASDDAVYLLSQTGTLYKFDLLKNKWWDMHTNLNALPSHSYCKSGTDDLLSFKFGKASSNYYASPDPTLTVSILNLKSLVRSGTMLQMPLAGPLGVVEARPNEVILFGGYHCFDSSKDFYEKNDSIYLVDLRQRNYEVVGKLAGKWIDTIITSKPTVYDNYIYCMSGWHLIQIDINTYQSEIFHIRELRQAEVLRFLWVREMSGRNKTASGMPLHKLSSNIVKYIIFNFTL